MDEDIRLKLVQQLSYKVHNAVLDFVILWGIYPARIDLGVEYSKLLLDHLPVTQSKITFNGLEVVDAYDESIKTFRIS